MEQNLRRAWSADAEVAARKPRVLTIISTIEPEVGGPSYSAVNAVLAERAFGVDSILVSTVPAGAEIFSDLDRRLLAAGAPHRRFPRPRYATELVKRWGVSVPMARWLIRNARHYDVVHTHYVWSFGTVLAFLLGGAFQIPVVLTPHESLTTFGYDTSRSSLRRRQKLWLSRRMLAHVDAVFLSSQLEERDSPMPPGIATVIPHPVPADGLATDVRTSSSSRKGRLTIGYLGRFHEKKRVGLLIEALADLPDVHLVVGGDEPPHMLSQLRQLAGRAGVADRVDFRGFVPESERLGFLAEVDLLAMPSTYECFGMVAAEAMMAGVPVVVTSQCGVAAFVAEGDAGVVFDSDRPEALTAVLAALANEPDRLRAMGLNASRVAHREFSYTAYATLVTRAYRQVIESGGRCDNEPVASMTPSFPQRSGSA